MTDLNVNGSAILCRVMRILLQKVSGLRIGISRCSVKLGNGYEAQRCSDESLLEGLTRDDDRFIGEHMYQLLASLEQTRQDYIKGICRCSKSFKELKCLKSIPSIGDIQAAKIVSQVVDPFRFATKYKFYSYCGLVRHIRESADKKYGTKRTWGNGILKCVYKMAGRNALQGNSRLRVYYDALRERGISHDNAYNAVCRKIAAISLSVWKHNKSYDESMIQAI